MLGNADVTPTIAVKDLALAREFYESVLGLTVSREMPEAQLVLYKSGNGEVQVYASATAGSNQSTYATWEVDDIEAVVDGLKSKGVTFEHYDMPGTSLEGDVHVMQHEKAAWFKDPDGNILCLHSQV